MMTTLLALSALATAVVQAQAQAQAQTFTVNTSSSTAWQHHWEESVGSGHAALTTRADWRAHLTRCAQELGVKRTRFHGLLDDDFSISMQEGAPDYVNLDSLVDFHLSIGMEPLFEVSFMPSWLATNKSQTVCHYKGITSPPTDYAKWGAIVHDMVAHLYGRYGANHTFMFEVWNEPNGGFFTPGDLSDATKLAAYLQLYRTTADAVKAASAGAYLVGGPATAGCPSQWLDALVTENVVNGTAVDFMSCHAYGGGSDLNTTGNVHGLGTDALRQHAAKVGKGTGVPTVLTEWSSSWSFNNGYHDHVASAPFIIDAVGHLDVDISSYWTFSDVFEEGTLIPVPFHGGFGLLTIHGTPKPAYRAFELLHGTGKMRYGVSASGGDGGGGACATDAGVLATSLPGGGGMRVFLYNHPATFGTPGANCTIVVGGTGVGPTTPYRHSRIDAANANPVAAWVAMGRPTYPTAPQLAALEAASELRWSNAPATTQSGELAFDVPANGMVVVDVLG